MQTSWLQQSANIQIVIGASATIINDWKNVSAANPRRFALQISAANSAVTVGTVFCSQRPQTFAGSSVPDFAANQVLFTRELHGPIVTLPVWCFATSSVTILNWIEYLYITDPGLVQLSEAPPMVQQPYVGSGVPNFEPYIEQLQAMLNQLRTANQQAQ